MIPVLTIDPEWLFPFFFESYYYEIFTGNDLCELIFDSTYETVKNNVTNQFGVSSKNSYLYAIVPNRHTKAFVRHDCADYNSVCVIAQINNSAKTKEKVVIPFKEIPKADLDKYFLFLRTQENSVKEGRWGIPKKDANGKTIYLVALFDTNGNVIRIKETTLKDQNVTFEETDSNGQTINVEYEPYYRRSKAHPNIQNPKYQKYNYTLDLQENKVQWTIDTTTGNTIVSRWYLHQDYLGINTIAYGHRILDEEIKTNKMQISDTEFVTDWINNGLTDEQAFKLLIYDYIKHAAEVKKMIEAPRWNALPVKHLFLAIDLTYNGGPKGLRGWPKLCTAMGIPPKLGNTSYFWPSVKEFKLENVDENEINNEFKRNDVPNRDAAFKELFLK